MIEEKLYLVKNMATLFSEYPHGLMKGGRIANVVLEGMKRVGFKKFKNICRLVVKRPLIYRDGAPLYGLSAVECARMGVSKYLFFTSTPAKVAGMKYTEHERIRGGDVKRYLKLKPALRWVALMNYDVFYFDYDTNKHMIDWEALARRIREHDLGYVSQAVVWSYYFNGHVPQRSDVLELPRDHIRLLKEKKRFKAFLKYIKERRNNHLPYREVVGYAIAALLGSVGDKLISVIDVDNLAYLYPQDAVEEVGSFLYRVFRDSFSEEKFDKAMAVIRNRERVGLKGRLDDLYAQTLETLIEEDPIVAYIEMGDLSNRVDPNRVREEWEALSPSKELPIPQYMLEGDGLVLSVLSKDNPLAAVVGQPTNCCQYLTGVGHSCVVHSITSPDGCCVVVYEGVVPIATSWVWKRGELLVYDNIEVRHTASDEKRGKILNLFVMLAHRVVADGIVKEVRCGIGSSDVDLGDFELCNTVIFPRNYDGYTDCKDGQVYIVRSEQEIEFEKDKDGNVVPIEHVVIAADIDAIIPDEEEAREEAEDGWIVQAVREIEAAAYPEQYRMLTNCRSLEDISGYVGVPVERLHMIVSRTWYCIIGEHDDYIEVADLASSTRSMSRDEMLSLFIRIAEIAAGREILMDARESTSYPLVTRLADSELIEICSDEPFDWGGETFHNLTIVVTESGKEWLNSLHTN